MVGAENDGEDRKEIDVKDDMDNNIQENGELIPVESNEERDVC